MARQLGKIVDEIEPIPIFPAFSSTSVKRPSGYRPVVPQFPIIHSGMNREDWPVKSRWLPNRSSACNVAPRPSGAGHADAVSCADAQ